MKPIIDAELAWDDLRHRLEKAAAELNGMGIVRSDSRLLGKAEGVRLALSYMDDYRLEVES